MVVTLGAGSKRKPPSAASFTKSGLAEGARWLGQSFRKGSYRGTGTRQVVNPMALVKLRAREFWQESGPVAVMRALAAGG